MKTKYSSKNVTPSEYSTPGPLTPSPILAFKTETSGSLYSHALLILTKSSKSINQVVHEQKFKDQRFMRGLGFILNGGNILSLDFFQFRLVCENPD